VITSGRTIVPEIGKPVPLVIDTFTPLKVYIYAITGQTGFIAVGDKNVSQVSSDRSGLPLQADDFIMFENEDMSLIYIDSSVVDEGIRWLAIT